MVKPAIPGFVIVKPEEKNLSASEFLERLDRREFLGNDYDPLKKQPKLGVILPEQKEKERDFDEEKIVIFISKKLSYLNF